MAVGQEVEDVEVALAGFRALHGNHVLGGVVGQPAVQNVGADGSLIDLAALDHLRAADRLFLIVDVAHRVDVNAVGIVVFGVLLHHPVFQRSVLGQIERAAAAGGLGTGAELVGKLLQQRAVGGLVGSVAQQAEKAREIKVQGVGQGCARPQPSRPRWKNPQPGIRWWCRRRQRRSRCRWHQWRR